MAVHSALLPTVENTKLVAENQRQSRKRAQNGAYIQREGRGTGSGVQTLIGSRNNNRIRISHVDEDHPAVSCIHRLNIRLLDIQRAIESSKHRSAIN